MARIKYFNPYTGKWEYADKQYAESSGGADKYDLVIPIYVPTYEGFGNLTTEHIGNIDWDAVRSTGTKLRNGENVKVVINGSYSITTGAPCPVNIYPVVVMDYYEQYLQVHFFLPNTGLRTDVELRLSYNSERMEVYIKEITRTDFQP